MKYVLTFVVLGIAALALTGCNDITADSIRSDLPKDLHTPGETKGQVDNRVAFTSTVDLRNFNQDMLRFMLMDRPSRSLDYPSIGE